MKRRYEQADATRVCQHCDGDYSEQTRNDPLRGWVCRHCDCAIDQMEAEETIIDEEAAAQEGGAL